MLRHVIAPSSGWTKASNTVVRDRRINSNAKILILYVQGLPDSATNRPLGELALKLNMKGRPYQQAKKQLVEHGYVHEWRGQGEDGLWATDQLFTNTPLTRAEARAVWTRLEQTRGALRVRGIRRSVNRLLGRSVAINPRKTTVIRPLPTRPPKRSG
ncbi:hypothetical protein G6W57_24085 [Streptomyces sp. CAI-121]|uniref:hypothetical protein n=1 Tax=unclassified Streptomyces TaxID=2593676 RepID=UPI0015872294|nr:MULTISPECIES: hypothetical protein [unclassified Streptomyces]NUV70187.1 hypothetical protein [Streptomyces sp. CAI-121]NUW16105.1 hypothetical protein [Streptomyces sp. CAI-68]